MRCLESMSVGRGAVIPAAAAPPLPTVSCAALTWGAAPGGGLQDVFFHPNSWPDNHRVGLNPNTELSLVVEGAGAGGVFADIWSCNSYSQVW